MYVWIQVSSSLFLLTSGSNFVGRRISDIPITLTPRSRASTHPSSPTSEALPFAYPSLRFHDQLEKATHSSPETQLHSLNPSYSAPLPNPRMPFRLPHLQKNMKTPSTLLSILVLGFLSRISMFPLMDHTNDIVSCTVPEYTVGHIRSRLS